MPKRYAQIDRKTKETQIKLTLNLDGTGKYRIDTSIPFLDHMLTLFTQHGIFDLTLTARGDREVDDHHLVEDIGICLGMAIDRALTNRYGINRYGFAFLPMDECLSLVSLDISGRPYLRYEVNLPAPVRTVKSKSVDTFDLSLIEEFFHGLVNSAKITVHIQTLTGKNAHHIIESIFKSFGRTLSTAVTINPRIKGIPSTKGKL